MLSFADDARERRIYKRNGLSSEKVNIYKQHIRQPQYQQLALEERLRNFGDEKFHVYFFQDSLRK